MQIKKSKRFFLLPQFKRTNTKYLTTTILSWLILEITTYTYHQCKN